MAHNRLSSLPSDFGHLTHLRYINLKHNNFTALPHVVSASDTTFPRKFRYLAADSSDFVGNP